MKGAPLNFLTVKGDVVTVLDVYAFAAKLCGLNDVFLVGVVKYLAFVGRDKGDGRLDEARFMDAAGGA